MRQQLTSRGNKRLLMLFGGWASDATFYQHLHPAGYDVMALWDYRDLVIDTKELGGYEEIVVVAWSFGAPAAAHFLNNHPTLPVTARVAINATLYPSDNALGIPNWIFNGTLDNLDPRNLFKFLKRGGIPATNRDVKELKDELAAIGMREIETASFDTAYIGSRDRIIPPANQANCWQRHAARVVETGDTHFPDFEAILRRVLTNKPLVASRFARAAATYSQDAGVQQHVASKLLDLWNPVNGLDILEAGCGTGLSTRLLLNRCKPRSLTLMDLSIMPGLPSEAKKIECDAETEILNLRPASLHGVMTASAMQWFNSAAAFIRSCSQVLKHGGVAAIATYGNETYAQLREICGIEKRYPDAEHLRQMVPKEMKITAMETERVCLKFDNGLAMLRHIKATGVNSLSSGVSPVQAARAVIRTFPGTCTLVYEPIYMILTKQ